VSARTADTAFRDRFLEPPYFEDLSERAAVKLTSMLRLTGRPHYTLWAREIGGPHFKERTGQFFPIYYLDVSVTDVPIETREPVAVEVTIRLGKQLLPDGGVDRLVSEAWTEVHSRAADGRAVSVGRSHKQSVFTRPHPNPARRRVTELHPSLGLGRLPERAVRLFTVEDLREVPEGYGPGEPLEDAEAHVWSYQQSDPNQHVHAMEYVRVMETFAADALARRGRRAATYHFARARVLFRRPCFTGEWYRRTATRHAGRDGAEIIAGAIWPVAGPDAPLPATPATVVQLSAEKSLLSGIERDKGP
jgi:hypothetical protein